MPKKVIVNEYNIVKDYDINKMGIYDICEKYHIGKIRVKNILKKYNIELKKKGGQSSDEKFIVSDWKIEKYPKLEGSHYIVTDPNSDFNTTDIVNKSGVLTTYIEKTYGITTPTLYDRRMYYMRTGNYWWEQWLTVQVVKNRPVKKCPYCKWETVDVENKSGWFEQHIINEHGITVEEHLKKYPEDINYFNKYRLKKEKEELLKKQENYVVCPICGKKFEKLAESHIKNKHHIEWDVFKNMYPGIKVMSDNMIKQTIDAAAFGNLKVSKKRFVSVYERELHDFLDSYDIKYVPNRQILIGKEIDMYLPDFKLGIEFDGLKFHTEFFGKKSHSYHLDKTLRCNEQGVGLIHIFEDEYVNHKDIVLSKLKHALKLDLDLPKIPGRKCEIKEIIKYDAEAFLEKYHIQGFSSSTVYLGAFYKNKLVAVMTFKNGGLNNYGWELTRFATDNLHKFQGVGGKIFSYFTKKYKPYTVSSFADRRWTTNIKDNLYTKIGFEIAKIGKPDYRYYNERVERYTRFHKMHFQKNKLITKYNLDPRLTETEMMQQLGFDRIWDCGLIKYIYKNPNYL